MTSKVIKYEADLIEKIYKEETSCGEIMKILFDYDHADILNYCLFNRIIKFMIDNSAIKFRMKLTEKDTIEYYRQLLMEFVAVTGEDIPIDEVVKYLEYKHTIKYSFGIQEKLEFLYAIELDDNERTLGIKKEILSECLSMELAKEDDLDIDRIVYLNENLKKYL